MVMPLKTFEVVLDVDVDESDTRTVVDVRQMIWDAILSISSEKRGGAIVSLPVVRELRSTTDR